MRWTRSFAIAATLVALGCGGGGSDDDNGNPTGPPPGGGGATNGTFTVVINGVTWSATGTVTVNRSGDFVGLGAGGYAGSTLYAIVLGIGNASSPSPHNLDVYAGGDGSSVTLGSQTNGWSTAFQGGGGTVTVSSLTSNRIVGTFSGTAILNGAGSGPLTLTGGQFDITF